MFVYANSTAKPNSNKLLLLHIGSMQHEEVPSSVIVMAVNHAHRTKRAVLHAMNMYTSHSIGTLRAVSGGH